MTAEKLEVILNKLLREITRINTNWIIWNGLREEMQQGAEYENLLEYSPCFWTVILDNLLSSVLLGTAKLYDEDKQCMGLQKVINICEQNQKLFPQKSIATYSDGRGKQVVLTTAKNIGKDICEAKQSYQEMQNFRAQLITLRDKYLAHTDKNIFLNVKAFYQDVALKKEALERLIETAASIVNSFLSNLSNTVVHSEFQNSDDYKKLLNYAKEGKESYLQKIRAKNN